jgi:hypothetical protein
VHPAARSVAANLRRQGPRETRNHDGLRNSLRKEQESHVESRAVLKILKGAWWPGLPELAQSSSASQRKRKCAE